MADLRIVDSPLLSTVKGTEKIPTGGEGNFSVSVNQVADFAKLKWFLATEEYVDNAVGNIQADLNLHKNNSSNPHQVTKEQVGLANVDNTADLDKPVSNATQSAIITANSGKADKSYVDSQDQLKADKNTVETSLLLKADKVDLKASKISSDGNQTQQEINDFGGAKWYAKSDGYEIGATVKLDNGDTVQSTAAANTVNPNVNMTWWVNLSNPDGYIVVNGVRRENTGAVNIEWFGGKTGIYCDDALDQAINYVKANPTRPHSAARGGLLNIAFNSGVYLFARPHNILNVNGFTIHGAGIQTTTLCFTQNTGDFLSVSGYINFNLSDMTIACGTYDIDTKYINNFTEFGATCLNFDGIGGGTKCLQDTLKFTGWDRVYKTVKSTINCDMHDHRDVQYENNNVVWDNSNVNAVSWSFDQCYTYGTRQAVLLNPCNTTRFYGGDHINPAPFFKLNIGGLGNNCDFSVLRFEFWKRPVEYSGEFKYLDVSTQCEGTVFRQITTFGLPATPDTVTTGVLSKYFDIKFYNCKLYGTFNATADVYTNASKSVLSFIDCSIAPKINHIYLDQTIKTPIGVNYIRLNTQTGYNLTGTTINRYYRPYVLGVAAGLSISSNPMIDTFHIREAVNANSFTWSLPVWNVAPFVLQLSKIKLALHKNTSTATLVVNLYSDAAKTLKIATLDFKTPVTTSSVVYSVVEITPQNFLSTPQFSGTDSKIYLELVSDANAGVCYTYVELEYIHVGTS